MSETDNEGEAHVHLEDERKLMRSVLAQFDAGGATTEQPDTEPPVEVGIPHGITAALATEAVLRFRMLLGHYPRATNTQRAHTTYMCCLQGATGTGDAAAEEGESDGEAEEVTAPSNKVCRDPA